MATKRTRITRNIQKEISPEMLAYISDDLLGEPREGHSINWFILSEKDFENLWREHEELILTEWIKANPGTRPSFWWDYSAPRMSAEEIERRGWKGCFWVPKMPEPRKRLGGIGDPAHEHLAYTPSFDKGIPDHWVSKFDEEYYNGRARDIHGNLINSSNKEGDFKGKAVDPNDPPKYESQAIYLKRHGLFMPDEERRLPKEAYEPEVVLLAEEGVTIQ